MLILSLIHIYYLVDPDQDSSKYQKLGEISESKFKNLENRKEDSLKKDTTEVEHHQENEESIEEKSSLTIHKTISTIRDFETKDLKKLIKKKFREVDDFTSETGKRTEEYDYKYDDKGNICLLYTSFPWLSFQRRFQLFSPSCLFHP